MYLCDDRSTWANLETPELPGVFVRNRDKAAAYGILFPSARHRAANEVKTAAYVFLRNPSRKASTRALSTLS